MMETFPVIRMKVMDENIDTGRVDENDMKPVVDGPEDGDLGADTGSTDTPAAE